MSVKSERVYWVECDVPGCDNTSILERDSARSALEDVSDWKRDVDGKFTCWVHGNSGYSS